MLFSIWFSSLTNSMLLSSNYFTNALYTPNWLSHKIYLVHWLDRIQKRINTFSALSNESCTHYSVWLSMRISAPNYSSLAFLSIAIERVPSEGCRWLTFNLTHMIYTWYVILFLVNFAGLHSFAQPMSNWCCYLTAWLARVSNWHLPRTLFSHLISLIGWSKHRCCTFFTNHETVWCWFYRFALVPFYWKIILYFVYICFFFFLFAYCCRSCCYCCYRTNTFCQTVKMT